MQNIAYSLKVLARTRSGSLQITEGAKAFQDFMHGQELGPQLPGSLVWEG